MDFLSGAKFIKDGGAKLTIPLVALGLSTLTHLSLYESRRLPITLGLSLVFILAASLALVVLLECTLQLENLMSRAGIGISASVLVGWTIMVTAVSWSVQFARGQAFEKLWTIAHVVPLTQMAALFAIGVGILQIGDKAFKE